MSATPIQLAQVNDVLAQTSGVFTYLPKITAPHTTIVNRAQCVDPSADHLPKFGVNRASVQQLAEVQGESGPNGERVFRALNDQMDQVRFVGAWINGADTRGSFVQATTSPDFVEITFYGTGLNILVDANQAPSFTAGVDGGARGSVLGVAGAAVLHGRNYAANQVINVASGLTLGVHTVSILCNTSAGLLFYGYEVVNATSTLQLVPGSSYVGGQKVSKAALSTDAYNSNFESGALNATYGGHAVVYQKADGTVKKAVQSNSGGALYLTSTNHANESVLRTYAAREFGAGRSDDFSLALNVPNNLAFTLDDGTTTLVGSQVAVFDNGSASGTYPDAAGAFLTFTFVGTGLDIFWAGSSSGAGTMTVYVDGVSVGTITNPGVTQFSLQSLKIASGLAYGSHTIKFLATGSSGHAVCRLVTYGPTKPAVPAGAVELCDYYLMGNYVANATASIDNVAAGILRKMGTVRESVFAGSGWLTSNMVLAVGNEISGWQTYSNTVGDYQEVTFFGTGFEWRGRGVTTDTAAATVSLQNVSGGGTLQTLTSTNFPGLTVSAGYGCAFTYASGNLAVNGSNSLGAGFSVSGLALGLWKVRVATGTGGLRGFNLDVITPVHSPKGNLPSDLQNTQMVGSNALGDSRKFPAQSVKVLANWVQAVGIANSPTTTSTSNVPVPDMAVTIKTSGNPIRISYAIDTNVTSTTSNIQVQYQIYVDGNLVGPSPTSEIVTNNNTNAINYGTSSASIIWPVTAGVHAVAVYWNTGGGTINARGTARILTVKEEN